MKLIINSDYDFEERAYVPIRLHQHTGFSKVVYQNFELRRPIESEFSVIAEWFRNEEIYGTFGFSRPPSREDIQRSMVPDLDAREQTLESVEFLMARDIDKDKDIGFVIVYEVRGSGDPNQELDFCIANNEDRGSKEFIKDGVWCIASYLFAVRAAQSISWFRRKRVLLEDDGNSKKITTYNSTGKPFKMTRSEFKNRLERNTYKSYEAVFPIIYFEHNHSKK